MRPLFQTRIRRHHGGISLGRSALANRSQLVDEAYTQGDEAIGAEPQICWSGISRTPCPEAKGRDMSIDGSRTMSCRTSLFVAALMWHGATTIAEPRAIPVANAAWAS